MEVPWPLDLTKKETRRKIKLQKTPRDREEHGEYDADAQGKGDRRM